MLRVFDIIQCGVKDAMDLCGRWRAEGISGVINVAHNTPRADYDPWLPVLRHPHDDEITPTREWFNPVLAFYDWARTKGKVLIHCQAGGNRSVGTTTVLLIARHGMNADQALKVTGLPGYGAWIRAAEQFVL